MTRILSQAEIDSLLSAASAAEREAGRGSSAQGGVLAYDFRRPDRVSKDQLRSLHLTHDRFARNLSTSLSAFLRSATEVTIVSVEQCAYAEFLTSLPDVTAFYALNLGLKDATGAFELNSSVAFAMVDRMLGGTGGAVMPPRGLTEIEQNVVDTAVKLILESLTEAWKAIIERVEFSVQGSETRPQMLQVVEPNEVVIVVMFDVKIAEARGMLNLCVPASVIELEGSSLAKTAHRIQRMPTGEDERRLLTTLARVPLPVAARLETTMRAHELVALKVGDVLSLGQSARLPVDVLVGSTPKYRGQLAARGGSGVVSIVKAMHGDGAGSEEAND